LAVPVSNEALSVELLRNKLLGGAIGGAGNLLCVCVCVCVCARALVVSHCTSGA
jgi:hypothetical protein